MTRRRTEIGRGRAASRAARSPYTLRRSPRARTLRVVIHPDRGVVVTVPAAEPPGLGATRSATSRRSSPTASRGSVATSRRQAADAAELAARGGLRDGALLRYRGDLHRLRLEPARAGVRRSTVERVGGRRRGRDHRPASRRPTGARSAAVLEAWFQPRARTAIEREIARHARGARRRRPVAVIDPRPADALGERVARRAGCPSRGG